MKKLMFRIGIVAVILLTAFPLVGQTTEVTLQTAEQVARTFWNLHHDGDAVKLSTPMHRLGTPWDAFYIFAPAEGKGFVYKDIDQQLPGRIHIYPSETFAGNKHEVTKNSYAIHMCAHSWHLTPWEKIRRFFGMSKKHQRANGI